MKTGIRSSLYCLLIIFITSPLNQKEKFSDSYDCESGTSLSYFFYIFSFYIIFKLPRQKRISTTAPALFPFIFGHEKSG